MSGPAPGRPIMRYHGGKWRLAPWIIGHFPEHRVYCEPYGGGGSVLLRKPRSYAEIYNDLSEEIVNLFRVARDQGEKLALAMRLTPFARTEFELSYEMAEDPLERARRTLVRCGMGFGSTGANAKQKTGFRGSATRSGSTPAADWAGQAENLPAVIDRLRGVVIEQRPALDLIAYHDSEDTLFYIDPPYLHSTRTWTHAKDCYQHEMLDADHRALAAKLQQVIGMVIVSGYASALYEELYHGWDRSEKRAMADAGKERTEVLWLRNVDRGEFDFA